MKFIHLADVHFDMPMIALNNCKNLIKERRSEQKKAFHDVIQYAKQEHVDCLFIAGDLFEQKFVEKNTIDYIISNFKLIPEINIFITPGNHDPYIKNSPYDTYEWPENVTIFKSEYGMISLEDADIYGIGFEDYEMESSTLDQIQIEDPNKINILITHGTLNGNSHKYHDIKEKELKIFDYVALGHIHQAKVDDSRIIYPGSILACGFDEPGKHGFIYGDITKESCKIVFKELPYKEFKKVYLDVSNIGNYHEVIQKLDLQEDIYEIKLTGMRNLDIDELIENIKEEYSNVCKIKDNTILPYDLEKIQNEETLKGIFTKKMLQELKEMNELEKQEAFKVIDLVYKMMN